ncbi:hypothetical protein BRE01_49280 [Brevibacillus reuszeri]|uniref:Uncharacterized protein n=1 Tax=Brevibacillus reuszeri TaxID=54915 RepID=A0A0K9YMY3_9BACL|nr:hypothetical protein [Brevibacillus reuszeri]KNB69525.1 hypothetical protein ADS79_27050 [Brevibacillus reuszeri]MED1856109.1 hypothetical protein [Brevibacillus reuszeri]GED71226.1 hypothetical protein BRE01_49280 [Brevibacillus reuszeri]
MSKVKEQKVLFIIISEDADSLRTFDGTKVILFNPLTMFEVDLPFTLRAVISIGFLDFYLMNENILNVKIFDPNGEIIYETSEEIFEEVEKANNYAQGHFGLTIGALRLQMSGDYTIKTSLDGAQLQDQTFRVVDRNAKGR